MSRQPAFDTIVVAARKLQERKKALHCFSVTIPRMLKQIHPASGDMVVKHSVHGRSKVCTSIYIPSQPFVITHSKQHLLYLSTLFLLSCFLYTIHCRHWLSLSQSTPVQQYLFGNEHNLYHVPYSKSYHFYNNYHHDAGPSTPGTTAHPCRPTHRPCDPQRSMRRTI